MTNQPPRPNLLWILTDQQRVDALSCHGGLPRTPHLDQLAARGADLQMHFAQSPVCVPSRCTMFTGRYPEAHHCRENNVRLSPHEVHLPKILRHAGYHLGYFGKNHLLPEEQMAPNFDAYNPCTHDRATPGQLAYLSFQHQAHQRLRSHGVHGSALFHDFPDGDTVTGRIGHEAADYVKTAPLDQPWCATVSFHDPHAPHVAPRRLAALYPEESIPLPPVPARGLASKNPRLVIKQKAQKADITTDAEKRRYLACYAAMCSFIDEQVGQILAALSRRPDAANTIILFSSDHGDFNWHFGMGKKDLVLCDALLRVPCLLAWPGKIRAQTVGQTFTEHADLVPTLLELLGIPTPEKGGPQGRSFAPLLLGQATAHRSHTVSTVCFPHQVNPYSTYESFRTDWEKHHATPGHLLSYTAPYNVPGTFTRSLRTPEWRYVWSANAQEELYDHRVDPFEWHNLATDHEHAPILSKLRRECQQLHEALDVPPQPTAAHAVPAYPEWKC